MTMPDMTSTTPEQQRDLAAADAHAAIKRALLPLVQSRPDWPNIKRYAEAGKGEVWLDYHPATKCFGLQLSDTEVRCIWLTTIEGPGADDLNDTLRQAITAVLNGPDIDDDAVVLAVRLGADHVYRLRIARSIENLEIALELGGRIVLSAQRRETFGAEQRPTLH